MISLALIKSTLIEKGRRILKVVQYGAKTVLESAPFGDDANPLKDMTAIYGQTSEKGEAVLLGYINESQLSAPGEKRIYSLRPNGSLSFAIHLKNDGTVEVGGNSDNMVKYIPLDTALKAQDTAINAELTKIATAITSVGGTYVPSPVSTDISASRIDEIKTA